MEKKKITLKISTTDNHENKINAEEIRTFFQAHEISLQDYINLFISVLRKHEFTPLEIQKALHDYFIEVDKKDFPG